MAKVLTKSAADRAKQILSLLFRDDGASLKSENAAELLGIYWYAKNGSLPGEAVTLEEQAAVFLDSIADAVQAEWRNGKARQAAEAAAATARTEADAKDWTERERVIE